jgi:tetratricopeptide (TPR) repeat protein
MKRTERHHLKQNEFEALALQVVDAWTRNRRQVTMGAAVVAVLALGAAGYWGLRQRTQDKAHAMLADAMVVQDARVGPPAEATGGAPGALTFPTERERAQAAVNKYRIAADAYPSTDAGLFARYEEASLQVSLGNSADAVKAYQSVVDRAGDALYGQMAKLGLAEAYARSGQFEQAITSYKELAQRKDGQLPIDGILIQLGRTERDAGKAGDAQQTFSRLVEEFPESAFTADAKREIDALKKAKKT